jgi:serine/threonine protein kinase
MADPEVLGQPGSDLLGNLSRELPALLIDPTQFSQDRVLGSGVYLSHLSDGSPVSVRQFAPSDLVGRKLTLFCREVRCLSRCQHPLVASLIGFSVDPPTIITQYFTGGTLYYALHKSPLGFTPTQRTLIALGIASAMSHLHAQGIMHRDLKSPSVLLDDDLLPHICDFAIGRLEDELGPLTIRLGDPPWAAPEISSSAAPYGPKVDVYSFAMILFELASDSLPFRGLGAADVIALTHDQHERPPLPARVPAGIKKLIQLCWDPTPGRRVPFAHIVELFTTHRVAFEGTDTAAVDEFAARIPREGPFCGELTAAVVEAALTSNDPALAFCLWRAVNPDNFGTVFAAIFDLVRARQPPNVVGAGLFNLLHVITHSQRLLHDFAQSVHWPDLPFGDEKLSGVCLSLLLPVLDRWPEMATGEVVQLVQMAIPTAPLKTLRIFSTLINASSDASPGFSAFWKILFQAKGTMMMKGAGCPFLYMLYKYLLRSKRFRQLCASSCLAIFCRSLKLIGTDVIHVALTILLSLRPPLLPVDSVDLVACLSSPELRLKTLKLLAVSKPATVTVELIDWLVVQTGDPWVDLVLLSLCRTNDVARLLLANLSLWMFREGLPYKTQFRMMLCIILEPENRAAVGGLQGLGEWIANLAIDRNLDVLENLPLFIRKLPTNREFVGKLIDSRCVATFLAVVLEVGEEQVFANAYLLIELAVEVGYLVEFAAFVPPAMALVDCSPQFMGSALAFLELMSASPQGKEELLRLQVMDFLEEKLGMFQREMCKRVDRILRNLRAA